jgi:hypothetical protein
MKMSASFALSWIVDHPASAKLQMSKQSNDRFLFGRIVDQGKNTLKISIEPLRAVIASALFEPALPMGRTLSTAAS